MNHLVSTSLLLLTASGCDTAEAKPAAASATPAELTVNVRGLRNTDGGVVAYLHASESTFPRKFGQAAKTARRKAFDSSAITLRFDDVAPGTYALVVVHDENGNGKLDKNVVGFPKEGIGASNVAKGRPSWAKAKFEVSEDRSVRVTMQYF